MRITIGEIVGDREGEIPRIGKGLEGERDKAPGYNVSRKGKVDCIRKSGHV